MGNGRPSFVVTIAPIRADTHEGGLAERQLTDRQNDVNRKPEDAVHRDPVNDVLVGPVEIAEFVEHGQARLAAARPNSPTGRIQSVRTSNANAMRSLAAEAK